MKGENQAGEYLSGFWDNLGMGVAGLEATWGGGRVGLAGVMQRRRRGIKRIRWCITFVCGCGLGTIDNVYFNVAITLV